MKALAILVILTYSALCSANYSDCSAEVNEDLCVETICGNLYEVNEQTKIETLECFNESCHYIKRILKIPKGINLNSSAIELPFGNGSYICLDGKTKTVDESNFFYVKKAATKIYTHYKLAQEE